MCVARRPRAVAEGTVRPACDLVEQRQVAGSGGLVDNDGVDSSETFFGMRGIPVKMSALGREGCYQKGD